MNGRDLLKALIEVCAEEGKGMSIAISIADNNGICTTVKVNKKLQEEDPGHLETALVVLSATYYEQFIKPMMEAERYAVISGDEPSGGGTMQ